MRNMNESTDPLSISPSQLLARLNALRSLQEAAREKLHRQRQLSLPGNREHAAFTIQDLLSQMSADSTSYQTFQNSLQTSYDGSPSSHELGRNRPSLHRIRSCERIDGVAELNLSQESECALVSPSSGSSRPASTAPKSTKPILKTSVRKYIELEEMPILSPRKDFETLVLEKIKNYETNKTTVELTTSEIAKKPFLKRGEGLSRFGLRKDDLVIQNTKSLPWRRKNMSHLQSSESRNSLTAASGNNSAPSTSKRKNLQSPANKIEPKANINQNKVIFSLPPTKSSESVAKSEETIENQSKEITPKQKESKDNMETKEVTATRRNVNRTGNKVITSKTNKTWATILTQEQDTFLRQLKQSSYYRNFESPAKSETLVDMSCDENLNTVQQERENAEQNLFELLENKVSNSSFCSESSFFRKLFTNKPNCSGDSTPMILRQCLVNNPELLHLFPPASSRSEYYRSQMNESTVDEGCGTDECTECDHETCSSSSSCCTCKTIEETNASLETSTPQAKETGDKDSANPDKVVKKKEKDCDNLDKTVTATDEMKAEMSEMNAKLIATSELLKDRLQELEAEIETFRRENGNLLKLREEFDAEKQRFCDEKLMHEQKLNEEKVLSEYYLAEEKEKLAKQKQIYERYVREMRGRLNKKEKDEVVNLKKEITELKEEFRNKEARSTSHIARLRTQLKMIEKEKKDLEDECEKLKRENKRIQQVNTTTRRLSNLKYLTEINKKLAQIDTNDKLVRVVPDKDAKYKTIEMENRSRARRLLPIVNNQLRQRAKSVPNLTVTSRYAKYFSQRDAASQIERQANDTEDIVSLHSDGSSDIDYNTLREYERKINKNSDSSRHTSKSDEHLESLYLQKLQDNVADSNERRVLAGDSTCSNFSNSRNDNYLSKSPPFHFASNGSSQSKSPIPPLNLSRSNSTNTLNRSKSPVSILSNRSSMNSRRSATSDQCSPFDDALPESALTKSNEEIDTRRSVTRTNLNPTEIKRPDGTRELRFPNGNVKIISGDGKFSKFIYYNGDIKETFYDERKIKYYYAETKTYHTTHVDGLEVLQFPDGQVEKRYADGSVEIRLPNGSVRYTDPRNKHVSEEWRFPDGAVLSVSRDGEQVVRFPNGQVEVHAKDHKRREYPDGTVKLVYTDGSSETRYACGRVRIKDPEGNLVMDSSSSR